MTCGGVQSDESFSQRELPRRTARDEGKIRDRSVMGRCGVPGAPRWSRTRRRKLGRRGQLPAWASSACRMWRALTIREASDFQSVNVRSLELSVLLKLAMQGVLADMKCVSRTRLVALTLAEHKEDVLAFDLGKGT